MLREYVRTLEAENERLRGTIRDLREQLCEHYVAPRCLRLSASESILLGGLLSRKHSTGADLFVILYGPYETERQVNTVRVLVLRLRKKLKLHGIHIRADNHHAKGYWLEAEDKARLKALEEAERCPIF